MLGRLLDAVLGPACEPPATLAPGAVPPGVTFRSGRLVPAIGGVLGRMGGPAAAVTLGRTIVVHPDVELSPGLLVHELTHVRQWNEDPLFPLKYTVQSIRHGYRWNRYEVEARAEASQAFPRNPNPPRNA
ncbi:MAG TPA: DUF4157 domain-containing protein [Longimicrobium sp.]